MSRAKPARDLWVVTTYYNPVRWRSRRANFDVFRRRLEAPLLAIEWAPDGRWELGADDAELLLQVSGGDIMWQKERLLAIALARLPAEARALAWLDGDVVFAQPGWAQRTLALLAAADVVQPFDRVTYLDAAWTRRCAAEPDLPVGSMLDAGLETRRSFLDFHAQAGAATARLDLGQRFKSAPGGAYAILARPAYGHAWAARVDVLRQVGWYERCVLGGGDLLHAYALIGQHEALLENHRSVGWDRYGHAGYRCWAATLAGLRPACGSEQLLHLHHGALADRQYRSRIDGLAPFGLDVERDLEAGPGEPWRWARDRAALNDYVLAYLRNRNEDAGLCAVRDADCAAQLTA